MATQILVDDLAGEERKTERAQAASQEERVALERLALMSEDRAKMNPRRELEILALVGAGAGSDDTAGRI